jgi:amino acid transporter
MHAITSRFANVALALLIVFALTQVFYYFKFKHNVNLTDVDKSLPRLRVFSVLLGTLIFMAMLYLPSTGSYREVDLSPAARETAFQDLVHNQERIGNQLDQFREVLSIVLMISVMYLLGVSIFIGHAWKERQKRVSDKDPSVKKPLGLET